MDTLSADQTQEIAPPEPAAPRPALPPESPVQMPVQDLGRWSRGTVRVPERHHARPWLARTVVFLGMAALTAYGAWEMYHVVNVGGITGLEWALLALFVVNFSWIAISFTSALVGFAWLLARPPLPQALPERLSSRTAVLMPIYNEAPSRVFGAMQAIVESVAATGHGSAFDYFFVSDTTDPDVWLGEERAFLALRERLGRDPRTADARVWYRHRPRNTNRKAGNIGDWVTRWGGAYQHMLVLDADSLMTGHSVVRLSAAMEADPDAGIVQTLPLIINRNTLFARLQQFAARVYGPVIAAGLAVWSGRTGNYWGHNAIIRTAAFAAHCGMPDLSGRPPFGGHILSHDFVEAALIRRAGYAVYMLLDATGSYEESPPSLIDLSARDRRWAQGNLQHARVIGSAGLRLATRQHFATGIFSYLASPLWLLQLLVGITLALQAHYIRPEYFTDEFSLFPAWPRFDAERALALFVTTMGVLLAPKLLGLLLMLRDRDGRRACGGWFRLAVSAVLEIAMSALLAPIMMVIQSGAVAQIVTGKDSGWKPQRRTDGSIPFREIARTHRGHTVLGVVAGSAAYVMSPYLFAWMSPTILGLLLAIPLSWASGQLGIGLFLKRLGLLMTPEEAAPPAIAMRAAAFSRELEAAGTDGVEALAALRGDEALRGEHEAMLPPASRQERGRFEPERVMAQAKLGEAETIEEARRWLTPRERFLALHDRALLARIVRLPDVGA